MVEPPVRDARMLGAALWNGLKHAVQAANRTYFLLQVSSSRILWVILCAVQGANGQGPHLHMGFHLAYVE